MGNWCRYRGHQNFDSRSGWSSHSNGPADSSPFRVRILLWLLPIADIFCLNKILDFYRHWGVGIPLSHAKAGLIERWVGYFPVGIAAGYYLGIYAILLFLAVLPFAGGLELYLMCRGIRPWVFFKGKPKSVVARIFLLEAYNCFAYFVLGVTVGILISM